MKNILIEGPINLALRAFSVFALCGVVAFGMTSCGGSKSEVNTANANATANFGTVNDTQANNAVEEPVASTAQGQDSETVEISFTALCQYPELPNGCEITSLAALLNFYGYNVDKCDLSDNYLAKGPVGATDFHKAFVGNPRNDDAYGCYCPVLVNAANDYLGNQGSSLRAVNLTGSTFSELIDLLKEGTPVVVWGTQQNRQGHYSVTWNVDGVDYTWFTPEHCMVLVGYDSESDLVSLADPMAGEIVQYDRAAFEGNYEDLGNQALILQ